MSPDAQHLLDRTTLEYEGLPVITDLGVYIHFVEQLERMRATQPEEFNPDVLAMQLAVLIRINEYDRRIGMPEYEMPPSGDKKNGAKREVTQGPWASSLQPRDRNQHPALGK